MRVLVLGAGGVGGYFGGRLVEAGADVTFLVRPARAEKIATNGLVIASPLGDATVRPKLATETGGPFDLVLLSCKAYDLDDAIAAVRPAVGERTAILPLLNGLAHLDRLDEAFGRARVLGGLAHISATLGPDGSIKHLNKLQTLTYGPRDPSQGTACDAVDALFAPASFGMRRSEIVIQEMWEKFAFITAAASIGCLMRAATRDIMTATDGERLTLQMIEACNAVAAAAGHPIRDKAKGWATQFLTDRASDFKPSMLQDLERGGKIEADHLPGDMIRRGAALGVETNLLQIAYCQLQAYQNRHTHA